MIARAALLAALAVCAGCARDSEPQPIRRHLVYTLDGRVWIGDTEGRGMRPLVRGYDALVSPDGSKVAFHRCPHTRDGCPAHEAASLHVVSASGGEARLLAEGTHADAWFPDSRSLLATARGELQRIDVESGDETFLARPTQPVLGMSVAPDGDAVVFSAAAKGRSGSRCPFRGDLFVVASDGSDARRLSSEGRDSDPVWVDDGSILFAREPPGCAANPASGIWSISPDGTNVRPLLPTSPRRFARNGYYGLRPYGVVHGQPLVLVAIRSEWGNELAVLDTRTSRVRRVRRAAYVDHPSRNGRHTIGSSCGANGPCVIQLHSVPEGRPQLIANGNVGGPHWNR